jgi:hypothetical protein
MLGSSENHRFYILARHKLGDSAKSIHEQLVAVCSDSAPSYVTVARWVKDFRTGDRQSLEDIQRPGRPITSPAEQNVKRIQQLLYDDHRLTVRHMEEITGIPKTSIHRILVENLKMKKL